MGSLCDDLSLAQWSIERLEFWSASVIKHLSESRELIAGTLFSSAFQFRDASAVIQRKPTILRRWVDALNVRVTH